MERAQRYLDRLRSVYSGIFTTSDDRNYYEDDAISVRPALCLGLASQVTYAARQVSRVPGAGRRR